MNAARWLPALLAMTMAVAPGRAADEADSILKGCRAEPDDARRLACYDREMDRAGPSPPPAASSAEERFGREGAMTREEADRRNMAARELQELVATAIEISTRPDGTMLITLDNEQVWKQNRPDPFFRLKVGDTVKIEPAALGSFLLSGPAKRSTRATRVR